MFVNINVKNTALIMLAAVSFFVSGTSEIEAAWGDLDPSFGIGGIYEDAATDSSPSEALLQPDGKILLTGFRVLSNGKKRLLLRRFTANGAIDTTFGNGGSAVINALINPNNDYAGMDIALLSGGKIAVVGQAGDSVAVWVVNSNGYGDTGFGFYGMKILSGYTHKVQSIVAVGVKMIVAVYDANLERFVLIRLNADGTTDTTYGTNGVSQTNIRHVTEAIRTPKIDLIYEPDTKKTVIGGVSYLSNTLAWVLNIDRKNSNGSDDFLFFHFPIEEEKPFYGIMRIVKLSGGGYVYNRTRDIQVGTQYFSYEAHLTKLNNNGTINNDLFIPFDASLTGVQSDGKILVNVSIAYETHRYDENLNLLETIPYSAMNKEIIQPDDKTIQFGFGNYNKLTLKRRLAN